MGRVKESSTLKQSREGRRFTLEIIDAIRDTDLSDFAAFEKDNKKNKMPLVHIQATYVIDSLIRLNTEMSRYFIEAAFVLAGARNHAAVEFLVFNDIIVDPSQLFKPNGSRDIVLDRLDGEDLILLTRTPVTDIVLRSWGMSAKTLLDVDLLEKKWVDLFKKSHSEEEIVQIMLQSTTSNAKLKVFKKDAMEYLDDPNMTKGDSFYEACYIAFSLVPIIKAYEKHNGQTELTKNIQLVKGFALNGEEKFWIELGGLCLSCHPRAQSGIKVESNDRYRFYETNKLTLWEVVGGFDEFNLRYREMRNRPAAIS